MTRTCKQKTQHDVIDQEIYDFTLIGSVWHSRQGKRLTTVLIVLLNYCYLWGYVATGSNTLMALYWMAIGEPTTCETKHWSSSCQISYYIALICFMSVTIPLSFVNLANQGGLQVFMAFYRVIMFSVLIITCLIQLMHGPVQLGNHKIDTAWLNEWKFGGFGILFTHVSVAFSSQPSLPDALQPIADRKSLGKDFCILIHLTVGILCASVFTASVVNPVTLTYQYYTGRNGGFGEGTPTIIGSVIRYAVLFFPVINIFNEYPLVTYTLATNLSSAFPKSFGGKWKRIIIISISSLPPFFLGAIVGSVKTIFNLSGIIAFLIGYLFPCVYVIAARRIVVAKHGKKAIDNQYYKWYSRSSIIMVVFVSCSILSIIASTFVLYYTITALI
ncbi:Amino acid transporter transmembrane domain-containing protein [Entamoeba marina]